MTMHKVMFYCKIFNIKEQLRRMDQDEAFLELHPEYEDMFTYEEFLNMVESNNDPMIEFFLEETA